MKLTIYRQSGSPVNPKNQALYDEEFKALFDRCEAKAELVFKKEKGILTRKHVPQMIIMQRLLRFSERFLMRKYGGQDEVELPKSAKAWTALLDTYGQTPMMVAMEQNTGKIVLILMDELQ